MKLLVLRAQPAASRTARALERLGHKVIVAPLSEIAPVDGGQLPTPTTPYAAVIAASANAFAALRAESRAALADLPAMLVGARTAQAAETLGLRPLRPIFRTARELAAVLHETAPPGHILYLTGRDRRAEIETALRKSRRAFTLVETYAARIVQALPPAARTALRRGGVEAVLHYSARSARAYVALADAQGLLTQALAPVQLCLSAAVAQSLEAAGATLVRVAAAPDERHLLALLAAPRRS